MVLSQLNPFAVSHLHASLTEANSLKIPHPQRPKKAFSRASKISNDPKTRGFARLVWLQVSPVPARRGRHSKALGSFLFPGLPDIFQIQFSGIPTPHVSPGQTLAPIITKSPRRWKSESFPLQLKPGVMLAGGCPKLQRARWNSAKAITREQAPRGARCPDLSLISL